MSTSSLPPDIASRLGSLERYVRSLNFMRGVGMVVAAAGISLGLCLLADYLFSLSPIARILLAAIGVTVVARVTWKTLIQPLFLSFDDTELAAMVESAYPGIEEKLTSTLELNDESIPAEFRGSRFMRERLAKNCATTVQPVQFTSAVSKTDSLRALMLGAIALVLLLAPLFIWPAAYKLLFSRLVHPQGNFASVSNLYFEIPDAERTVARGSDVQVLAIPKFHSSNKKPTPKDVWIDLTNGDKTRARRMQFDPEFDAFQITLPQILQPFDYLVRSADGHSQSYHINVVDAPEVASVALQIDPPAYTGLPARQIDGAVGAIEVFEHSRIAFQIEFSKPVKSCELIWQTIPTGEDIFEEAELENFDLQLSDDRLHATWQTNADHSGRFQFLLTDEYGLHNPDEPDRQIALLRDQPPELFLSGSDAPSQAHPDDILRIQSEVKDDIGLGGLEMYVQVGEKEETLIPLEDFPLGKREFAHEYELNLRELGLQENQVLAYRVRAVDERPIPEPNETWSQQRFINVTSDAPAPGSQRVTAEQKAIQDELKRIHQEVIASRDATREQKNNVWKSKGPLDDADKELTQDLADKQSELTAALDDVSRKMAEHPLFANLAKDTKAIGKEDLSVAADNLNSASEQADKGQRANDLTKAERKLSEADWKLKNIQREFEKLAELERDLLELQRLADQTQHLADDTEQFEQQKEQANNEADPTQKQAALDQVAAQRDQLMQEQSKLTDDLNDLLERRPELVDASRHAQLDQLQKLADQARQLVEPQQKIADSLRNEASDTSRAAQDLERKQQQLVQRAEKLKKQARENQDVTPIDPAKLRQALEDLKQGDLAKAEQNQQQSAEELRQFAQTVRELNELASDPKKSLAKMAQKQAELAQQMEQAAAQQQQTAAQVQQAELAEQNASEAAQAAQQAQRDAKQPSAEQKAQLQADVKAARDKQQESKQALKQAKAAQQKEQQAARKLAAEQAALQKALSDTELPADNRAEQQTALNQVAKTTDDLLKKQDAQTAAADAARAAEQLEQLAEKVPSKEERVAAALEKVAELRKQQEQLQQDSKQNPAGNEAAEQAKQQAQKQAEIAQQLEQLDAPGAQSEQQAAAKQAAKSAQQMQQANNSAGGNDGQNQQQQNQQTTQAQQQVEQEMARLEKRLKEQETPDEQLARLIKEQQQLNQSVEQKPADPAQAKQQQAIADQIEKLDTPAARQEQQAAADAAKSAAQQMQNNSTGAEQAAAANKAQQAMQQLAQSLQNSNSQAKPANKPASQQDNNKQLAQQSEELADDIQELKNELEQLRQERTAENQIADASDQQNAQAAKRATTKRRSTVAKSKRTKTKTAIAKFRSRRRTEKAAGPRAAGSGTGTGNCSVHRSKIVRRKAGTKSVQLHEECCW